MGDRVAVVVDLTENGCKWICKALLSQMKSDISLILFPLGLVSLLLFIPFQGERNGWEKRMNLEIVFQIN